MIDNKDLLKLMKRVEHKLEIKDGLVQNDIYGHTCEVASLRVNHSGLLTAKYYVSAMLTGKITEEEGFELLKGIYSLRIEADNKHSGCLRWYAEETKINDTNGAFFIVMPLAFIYLYHSEILPNSHKDMLKKIFGYCYIWFYDQCSAPALYYTNKIMSDGALLLAISTFLGNESGINKSIEFWNSWCDYTLTYGWGSGEIMSSTYQHAILIAFFMTIKILEVTNSHKNLITKLNDLTKISIDNLLFHNGKAFVPAIRTYNFWGEYSHPKASNAILGLALWSDVYKDYGLEAIYSLPIDIELSEDYFKNHPFDVPEPKTPRISKQKIWEDTYAYTYISKAYALGTLSQFPAQKGSYQAGIGWQSMPVAFSVPEKQLSFLRFRAISEGVERAHPALDKNSSRHLRLFSETTSPEIRTICSQNENIAIVNRSLENISNNASEIVDEWVIQDFSDMCYIKTINQREWIILDYIKCRIAITALSSMDYGNEDYEKGTYKIEKNSSLLKIMHFFYKGEEKLIRQHRLENAWIVVALDDAENIGETLKHIQISDKVYLDGILPRQPYEKLRTTTVLKDEKEVVTLTIDPLRY